MKHSQPASPEEKAQKNRRNMLNNRIRKSPKWESAFRMYDTRIELARRGNDMAEVGRIFGLRNALLKAIRKEMGK